MAFVLLLAAVMLEEVKETLSHDLTVELVFSEFNIKRLVYWFAVRFGLGFGFDGL